MVEHLPSIEQFLDTMACFTVVGSLLVINVPGGDSWENDLGHLHSFWDDRKDFPDGSDIRTPHVIPECFDHSHWKVQSMAKHQWDAENYWYAVKLKRVG